MFEKVKTFLNPEMDLSKRKFIKTAAGLAALTVIGVKLSSIAKIAEIEEQIKSGVVTGQTFYLDKTLVIDIPDVVIVNCKFVAVKPMDVMISVPNVDRDKPIIHSCMLDGNGMVGVGASYV